MSLNNGKILISSLQTSGISRSSDKESNSPTFARQRWQIIRLYLTAMLLLSAMLTVYVWQSTKMIEVKLRIKGQEKYMSEVEDRNADLRTEISGLQSLNRIESFAKNNLGMIETEDRIYISMPEKWNNYYD